MVPFGGSLFSNFFRVIVKDVSFLSLTNNKLRVTLGLVVFFIWLIKNYRKEEVDLPLFKKKTPPVLIKTALAGSCPPFTGIWKTKTALSKVEKEHLLNYRKISTEFQDSMGLDIICEGELARSVGSTHPFYESAYIYYFAQFLEGVDNNICIKNKISLLDPTFINEDYEDTKRFTKKPIKVTLPGPVTFVERVKNEYYKSKVELIEDYSVALKEQIKSLIDLGVEYIHIDDPHYLYMGETHELYSVKKDIMTEIVELDKKDTKFVVHMCLWNPFKEDLEHHNTKCDINSYYLNPNAFEIDSIENIDFLNIERANKNHTKFFTNKL